MGFTDPSFRHSVHALDSLVQSLAAHAPTPSATSNKVQSFFNASIRTGLTVSFSGSVGLVSRFGQFYKSVDPGLVQVNVCTESLRVVDVKIQISPIGRQKVITRDNVDVEM